jgi:undecaprenyl-diphosphatase
MLDKILELDREVFLFLNGLHNPFFDFIMYWLSDKYIWIPFYAFIIYILVREFKKKTYFILIAITFLITICDQTASGFLKAFFKRLRPSHEESLKNVIHLSEAGPGGKYGFISSHATNVFGLAVFLILLLPAKYTNLKIFLFVWAILVSYSRIYNGVHYPLDIICGIILGTFYGSLVKNLYSKASTYFKI